MKPETPLLTLQKVLDGHEHERVKFLEELNETRRNAATLCLGVSLLFYFGLLILFAGFLAHFGFFHEIAEAASGKGGLHFANAAGAGVMAGIFLILPTIAYIVVGRSICKVTVATIKASLEKKVEEKEEHIRTQGYSTIITSCLQYVGFDSVAAMKKGPKALSITEVPNSGIELIRATGNYKTWP
ncbi:MAG: hypothetical protein KDD62_11050, partial [Bdellovibrionales bacterium]|nr:hypothetical protein [Bdellovibrionales bacterium]